MEKVLGIGGFFWRSKDPKALGKWYEDHLGIPGESESYDSIPWTQEAGTTIFVPFKQETTYFSADKQWIHAVALVWDREERRVVEQSAITRRLTAPYIGGYLSFREGPALVEVVRKLKHPFGVVTFDGQGVAHPRRCGLASHVGLALLRMNR